MKLWLLERKDRSIAYDVTYGFVVRAPDEEAARMFAAEAENLGLYGSWESADYASCVELVNDGKPGVVLQDFNAG